MDNYTEKQLDIISNIANFDNEQDLNNGISNIQNMIIRNGISWYDVDKKLIINIAKCKRNKVGKIIWDKVKKKFGKLLKIIDFIDKKEILINNFYNKNKENGFLYKYIFEDEINFKKYSILPKFKINKISSGCNHVIILTENNLVFSYGHNTCGQLGYDKEYNMYNTDLDLKFI